jgi:hypothetical protein
MLKCRYKYVPLLIEDILFPSAESSTTMARSSSSSDGARPHKKRRRLRQDKSKLEGGTLEDVEMDDGTRHKRLAEEESRQEKRPVILETVKESYLLSPSTPAPDEGERRYMYDIALILEAEVVVEEELPVDVVGAEREGELRDKTPVPVPPSATLEQSSKSRSAAGPDVDSEAPQKPPVQIKTPPRHPVRATTSPVHSPEPAETGPDTGPVTGTITSTIVTDPVVAAGSLKSSSAGGPNLTLQVLQRNLTREMFRFEEDGVYVLDPGGSGGMGMETEWVIQVKSWKWAPGVGMG